MGTGPIKGFGVTLTIGVSVSLFSALVITRLIFDWMLSKNLVQGLRMLHIVRGAHFDFMKFAKPAFIASWLLIVIGNSYGLFVRGSDVLGVEFAGGKAEREIVDRGDDLPPRPGVGLADVVENDPGHEARVFGTGPGCRA